MSKALSGTQWTIAAAGHEAVVVEVGGGLRAYRAGGVDYVDGYGEDELSVGCAGQILAPWPNRIRDGRYTFAGEQQQLSLTEPIRHNALHGLVNWVPWRLAEQAPDAVTLECAMPAQPGYPWPLRLRSQWRVGPEGLRVTHEATNVGGRSCPFGFSVHPYLRLPGIKADDVVLRVPARNRLLVDSRLLPIGAAKVAGGEYDFTEPRRIGATVLDTAFGDLERGADGGSSVDLSTSDGAHRVSVWADDKFGWWQVFSSDTMSGDRWRRSLAVEPMTCPPDAFRSGRDLIVLEPDQTWSATWGIKPGQG
ncbi:aldose 1-epimerase family protein [Phytohabitans rumicis]|uniref:Aldose 1-epimerase n=1 Tax=Phytohabitans rumicis TaxID=1076125 RepID=A0A6V8L7D5_9ACTN|nr:aldose 1-epimerase family protein [Phytohabitans rumicis]GFJ90026.1 aldose 1-epimerase [Phytohabitans rumicis]